jgi:8-oxo-dGTP pyrophosphatase MutT (NUDIX family)
VATTPGPSDVEAALSVHVPWEMPALPGRRNDLHAGVLVPIVFGDDLVVLMTERAHKMRLHAGEVSFPGGRPEEGDADLGATALREAREEIGIESARLLGRLSSIPLYTSEFRLVPFVGAVPRQPLRAAPDEVERVLEIPVRPLLDRPHLEAIPWVHEGVTHLSPVFEHEDLLVYGGTAHVLHELLLVLAPLYGLSLPPLRPGRHTWQNILRPSGE